MAVEVLFHFHDGRMCTQHRRASYCIGFVLLVFEYGSRCKMHEPSVSIYVSLTRPSPELLEKQSFHLKFILLTKLLRLPWNQQTLIGYFGEICFDILTGEAFLTSGSFILFFISLCLHHQAFFDVFENLANRLGQPNIKQNDKLILCKVIRFHILVKK